MKKLVSGVLALIILSSCQKAELTGNYFAFGFAGNFAGKDGATFYLVKNGHLYQDDMLRYTESMKFSNTNLPRDKYLMAKRLVDNLPELLKKSPSAGFGCPDCRDQGGYHIQIGKRSSVKTFHIDADPSEQPEEIRAYMVSIKNSMEQLP